MFCDKWQPSLVTGQNYWPKTIGQKQHSLVVISIITTPHAPLPWWHSLLHPRCTIRVHLARTSRPTLHFTPNGHDLQPNCDPEQIHSECIATIPFSTISLSYHIPLFQPPTTSASLFVLPSFLILIFFHFPSSIGLFSSFNCRFSTYSVSSFLHSLLLPLHPILCYLFFLTLYPFF